jgi:Zn-finger nucleic acid-binding protein
MFGTLKPTQLSGCSSHTYQANFCGGCHAMAELGRPWALATGYDIAFLHLLLAALEDAPVEQRSCTAVPFRKLPVQRLSAQNRRWLVSLNLLLMAEKCTDDVADEGSWKGRIGIRLLSGRLEDARETVESTGFDSKLVTELGERQRALESEPGLALEFLAQPTSLLLGEVFAHAAKLTGRPEKRERLRHLGQGLGAAIYIKDARDDRERDTKRGCFNALNQCSSDPLEPYAQRALSRELTRAQHAVYQLDLGEDGQLAHQVLEELSPYPRPSLKQPLRSRQRGFCEILLCCDLGFCCDAGLCGEGCQVFACCPCDACACASGSTPASHLAVADVAPPKPSRLCPACGELLFERTYSGVDIDECDRCFGLWLDHGELEHLAENLPLPERLLRTNQATVQVRPEGTRPCPHCAEMLVGTHVKGVRIDLCPDCQGVWLDQGELNRLL